jgi:hypothetical protein
MDEPPEEFAAWITPGDAMIESVRLSEWLEVFFEYEVL